MLLGDTGKVRKPHAATPKAKMPGAKAAAADEADEEAAMSPLQQALKKLRQMKLSQGSDGSSPLQQRQTSSKRQHLGSHQASRFGPLALKFDSLQNQDDRHEDGAEPLTPGFSALNGDANSVPAKRTLEESLSALSRKNVQAAERQQRKPSSSSFGAAIQPHAISRAVPGPLLGGIQTNNPLANDDAAHAEARTLRLHAASAGDHNKAQNAMEGFQVPPQLSHTDQHSRPSSNSWTLRSSGSPPSPTRIRLSAHVSGRSHRSASATHGSDQIRDRPPESSARHQVGTQKHDTGFQSSHSRQSGGQVHSSSQVSGDFQTKMDGSSRSRDPFGSHRNVQQQDHDRSSSDSPVGRVHLASRLSISSSTAESPRTPAAAVSSGRRPAASTSSQENVSRFDLCIFDYAHPAVPYSIRDFALSADLSGYATHAGQQAM